MKLTMKSGRVIIDGREFTGTSFSITGNKVIVDGVAVEGELVGDINIQIFGDVDSLETTDGTVSVSGNSGSISTTNGDVEVKGSSTSIKTVNGNVTTSCTGSVTTTNGNISH